MKADTITLGLLALALAAPVPRLAEVPDPFRLAPNGCGMAHCDPGMTDLVRAPAPAAGAQLLWHDPAPGPAGAPQGSAGVGCSGNGTIVACTFGQTPADYPSVPCDPAARGSLVVYDYGGDGGLPARTWASSALLNCSAWTSAPMIGTDGGVMTGDDRTLIRFGADGTVLWQTDTAGGMPISPVMTDNGVVVLATFHGPISAYHNQSGTLLHVLDLTHLDGRFETINTPGVRGNRVYVLAQHSTLPTLGRLVAIDVTLPPGYDPANPPPDPGEVLKEAWSVEVGAPGGASPLVVNDTVYFDGNRPTPDAPLDPHIFAVRDRGTFGEIVWKKRMPGRLRASFARDPRGGFWAYTMDAPPDGDNRFLWRLALTDPEGDGLGNIVEIIDVDALIGEDGMHRPRSAMSIAGTASNPVLLVAASAVEPSRGIFSTNVVAIDLASRGLLWKVPVGPHFVASQYPILIGPAGPRAFFVTHDDGTRAIGIASTAAPMAASQEHAR